MSKKMILGADIGGSHISAALVDATDGHIVPGIFCKEKVDAQAAGGIVIGQWLSALRNTLKMMRVGKWLLDESCLAEFYARLALLQRK